MGVRFPSPALGGRRLPGLRRAAVRTARRRGHLARPGEAALAGVQRAILDPAAAPRADLGDREVIAAARLAGPPGWGLGRARGAPERLGFRLELHNCFHED